MKVPIAATALAILFFASAVNGVAEISAQPSAAKSADFSKVYGGNVWRVQFNDAITDEHAKAASVSGKMPFGDPSTAFRMTFDGIDLDSCADKPWKIGMPALAVSSFEREADATVRFGVSADWWFTLFVNGEKVGTTEPDGNIYAGYIPSDHICEARLRKGLNHMAVRVRRGEVSGMFFCLEIPSDSFLASARADTSLPDFFLGDSVRGEIRGGPWVTKVSTDRAEIGVAFRLPVAAGVRWRRKGLSEWAGEKWTMLYGQRDRAVVHTFALDNLLPSAEYEYEVFFLDEIKAETVPKAAGCFSTFAKSFRPFSFWATGDLQVGAARRIQAVRTMVEKNSVGESSFLASLGDVDHWMNNVSDVYLDSFLNAARDAGFNKPVVMVRGNHEFRGHKSCDFGRLFGRPYGSFLCNGAFFIILDTGEDKPVVWQPRSNMLRTDNPEYMLEQAEWLRGAVASDECRNAKYRIVIAHAPPFQFKSYMHDQIKNIAGEHFYGKTPACSVDLWLCGHIHTPYRYDPATRKLFTFAPNADKTNLLTASDIEEIGFPVYVNDGPYHDGLELSCVRVDVREDGLAVECRGMDGQVIDSVIFRKGLPAETVGDSREALSGFTGIP